MCMSACVYNNANYKTISCFYWQYLEQFFEYIGYTLPVLAILSLNIFRHCDTFCQLYTNIGK